MVTVPLPGGFGKQPINPRRLLRELQRRPSQLMSFNAICNAAGVVPSASRRRYLQSELERLGAKLHMQGEQRYYYWGDPPPPPPPKRHNPGYLIADLPIAYFDLATQLGDTDQLSPEGLMAACHQQSLPCDLAVAKALVANYVQCRFELGT